MRRNGPTADGAGTGGVSMCARLRGVYRVGPYRFSPTDARRTLAHVGDLWRHQVHRATSVPDRVAHQASDLARSILADVSDVSDVSDAAELRPGDRDTAVDRAAVELDRGGTAAADALDRLGPERTAAVLASAWDGSRSLGRAVAASTVPLSADGSEVARDASTRWTSGSTVGRVDGLFVSSGGVPKSPVASVSVDHAGVVGDSQASRQHHGRPWQALCLWSREVVDAFADAGHPIGPGSAGENVCVTGLDWSLVRPGVELRLGEVTCEISSYSLPCTKNARWFRDREFALMHHDRGPVSRVYATVVETGTLSVGDEVAIS